MRTRVWAPKAQSVEIVFESDGERAQLTPSDGGYFEIEHERVRNFERYRFSIDGRSPLPDPRSACQPEGVHGPSEWIDWEEFPWTDQRFRQNHLQAAVIYELHVGTFSTAGTFEGAIEHLDELKELGVTHVELMPVAHFPGSRGWGYDGVDLFAPHTAYGGPTGLMKFVDACHARGLAVLLDVVYNHLGPSGNYLNQFGPYFTSKYHTPWGDAFNYDEAGSDEVRRLICDNALHWLKNYHVDGLRLDAVHAIYDQSARHLLEQLGEEVEELSAQLDRPLVLIAESALNDPKVIERRIDGGYGIHAQWSDDFHHALHALLTGERQGYYGDYGAISHLAEALIHGFVYRGQYSPFRQHSYGAQLKPGMLGCLVGFSQNHDQVGNRARGDRLAEKLNADQLLIAAGLTLLGPFIPMLFMGEEWGATTPFQYFVDHPEPELAEAVRSGRQREFSAFGFEPDQVPDPGSEETFQASRLDRGQKDTLVGRRCLNFYRQALELRAAHPAWTEERSGRAQVHVEEEQKTLLYRRAGIVLGANFSDEERLLRVRPGRFLLRSFDAEANWQEEGLVVPAFAFIALEEESEELVGSSPPGRNFETSEAHADSR